MTEFTALELTDAIQALYGNKMGKEIVQDVAELARQIRDPKRAERLADGLERWVRDEAPKYDLCRVCAGELRTEAYAEPYEVWGSVAIQAETVRKCERCGEEQ